MTQVSVNVNGRTYRLRCASGQEDRLVDVVSFVKAKLDALFAEHGNAGDERVLLMASIMLADELFETRAALEQEREARAFAEELVAEAVQNGSKPVMKGAIDLVPPLPVRPARKGIA